MRPLWAAAGAGFGERGYLGSLVLVLLSGFPTQDVM